MVEQLSKFKTELAKNAKDITDHINNKLNKLGKKVQCLYDPTLIGCGPNGGGDPNGKGIKQYINDGKMYMVAVSDWFVYNYENSTTFRYCVIGGAVVLVAVAIVIAVYGSWAAFATAVAEAAKLGWAYLSPILTKAGATIIGYAVSYGSVISSIGTVTYQYVENK